MSFSSEEEFLTLIDRHFAQPSSSSPDPIREPATLYERGDDCSVLAVKEDLCISTDLFVEDIHFRRSYFPPEAIGHKSLAVNISDIAAMGAVPKGFTMCLTFPENVENAYWDKLLQGMGELADLFNIPLVGGDISAGDKLSFSITIWGQRADKGRFIPRKNCADGEVIFTVGKFGLAHGGLHLLEAKKDTTPYPSLVKAHLYPEPQISAGMTLAKTDGVTSLMDLSDGLARDLPRLLNLQQKADLNISTDMLHPELIAWAGNNYPAGDASAIEAAVLGGEDYALLGTCTVEAVETLKHSIADFTPIGTVARRSPEESSILLNGKAFSKKGFDHFT
ncbi:MAG: thiamine-phosphate kinase [Desulfovibrio sp.]